MAKNPLLVPFSRRITLNDDSLNLFGCIVGGSAMLGKTRSIARVITRPNMAKKAEARRSPPSSVQFLNYMHTQSKTEVDNSGAIICTVADMPTRINQASTAVHKNRPRKKVGLTSWCLHRKQQRSRQWCRKWRTCKYRRLFLKELTYVISEMTRVRASTRMKSEATKEAMKKLSDTERQWHRLRILIQQLSLSWQQWQPTKKYLSIIEPSP